jgi:hypothetical protein
MDYDAETRQMGCQRTEDAVGDAPIETSDRAGCWH